MRTPKPLSNEAIERLAKDLKDEAIGKIAQKLTSISAALENH